MWQLDLLGPPRLQRNGVELPLGLKKAQALLVLLALAGALPRTRVVAFLWPRLDETAARRNLRRELARLREAGAGDTLATQRDVLSLAQDVGVDLRDFEQQLQAEAPDDALRRWRGALADGLVLADAPDFEEWLARQRERWWRLRAQALEASAAACERRGDLSAALQRVQSLLEQDPLQEQRHRDAMRLLAALDQREAALAQYERCRVLLRDELGLAPMAQTEALVAQLRRSASVAGTASAGESAQPAPPGVGRPAHATSPLPDRMPFVGRADEVRMLEAAWQSGCTLLIEGEAGVGKSRLAIDFVAAHGPHAVVRCRPGDAAAPYAAFGRAVRAMAGPTPARDALPAGVADELARLLPEWGPAPAPLRNDAERARFIEACIEAWNALAAENFDAVVLDDWHHADAASRALVMRITERRHERRAVAGIGAREVLVYRAEGEPAEGAEPVGSAGDAGAADAAPGGATIPASLMAPTGGAPAYRLRLDVLPPLAVLDLMQQLSGAAVPQRFTQRVLGATAGNPFFVAETLRHWFERGLLSVDAAGRWQTPFDDRTQDYTELPVPGSVHATVLERVQRQGSSCRRVLEAAAMSGEPFSPALLAPACALSELDAVIAIDAAVQAQLVREHDRGGFAFVHDLVQQAIDSALAPERRRLVHRRLALAAESTGAAAATIAQHHEASGELHRAVRYRIHAGDEAQRLHAWREAAEHWQRGLADRPLPGQAIELHLRLMRAANAMARRSGIHEHAAALFRLARDAALAQTDHVRAITQAASILAGWGGATEALAALGLLPRELSPPEQREVTLARANAFIFLGDNAAATTLAQLALEEPELGARQRAEALYLLGSNALMAGRSAMAVERLETAIALQRELPEGNAFDLLKMTFSFGIGLYQVGRFEESGVQYEETAAGAAAIGHRSLEGRCRFNLACVRLAQLRPDASLEVARHLRAHLQHPDDLEFSAMLRCRFVEAHAMIGQLGAAWMEARLAVPEILAAPRRAYTLIYVGMMLSELLELLGDRTTLQPLLDVLDRMDAENPRLLADLAQTSTELWVSRAQAAMLAGDLTAAAQALQRIDEDRVIDDPRVCQRTQIARAEFALHSGRADDAARMLPDPALITPADGLRVRAWAVHIRAAATARTLSLPRLAAARDALCASPPQKVPAIPALYLHRALVDAVAWLPAESAASVLADATSQVHRLAAELAESPAAASAFASRWLPRTDADGRAAGRCPA